MKAKDLIKLEGIKHILDKLCVKDIFYWLIIE